MSIKKILLSLCVQIFTCISLQGEIQTVSLEWTAGQCELNCINMLTTSLEQIPGVASISASPDTGQATLKWKPNMPFAYKDIDYAFRRIGLANRVTHIRVLGTITHTNSTITLVSLGDYTNFTLLGSIIPSNDQEETRHNPLSYPLSQATKLNLLAIEQNSQTVIIEGRLLDPFRYFSSQYLIIEAMHTIKQ